MLRKICRSLLVTLFVLAWAGTAAAQIVTRGPYLQNATPTSIVVRWRTDSASDSRVYYGTSSTTLSSAETIPGTRTEHEVQLTGLSPEMTYYYAIGTTSNILAGGDPFHYFDTLPIAGTERPVRVWVIGDSGTANDSARRVRDAYLDFTAGTYTQAWLMLGDNAYSDGTDSDYQDAVFSNMYESLLIQTPLWPTLGNHDGHSADSGTQTGPYYDIFTLPTMGEAGGEPSGTEAYYSFDYANVHFVCLDSHDSDRSVGGDMLTWLVNDLSNTTQTWIVAYWHHPPYSKGSHDSDSSGTLSTVRENFLPILESYRVDLVLSGHSHSYERSLFIDGHYGDSSTFDPALHQIDGGDGREDGNGAYFKDTDGSVYIVAGSSGKTSGGSLNHPVMFLSLDQLGSLVLDFDAARLDVKFLDDSALVQDYFTILKTPTGNQPPIVSAGPDQSVVYPAGVFLDGSASDDDMPDPPALTTSWSVVTGQASAVTFGDPNAIDTTASFAADDVYVLRLTADDGELITSDDVTITVLPEGTPNQLPIVDAGGDQSITLPGTAILSGSILDDGLPNPPGVVTNVWTSVSGPGVVTFADANALVTTASFSVDGIYVLRLAADDGDPLGPVYDEVMVSVVQPPPVLDVRIATGNDDAEESESGGMNLTSSDLELVFTGGNQTVGMRFNGITIPQGATITNAYIQFQVDEASIGATSLTIEAEAADNAPAFTTSSGNISSRDRTSSVPWIPAAWPTVGAAGPDQQTPDIGPVIQDVVSRTGWVSGNSLVVIITGTGVRVAESYNGVSGAAALLHVEYQTGPPNIVPSANDDNETTAEDTTVTIDVAFNDDDPDGSLDLSSVNTTCASCSEPANGTLVNNGDATFDYTPNQDYNGSDSWVYEICDDQSACDTATVTVTVTPVADPPVAVDDIATTSEDTVVTVDVTSNDDDPDGDLSPATANTACVGCTVPSNGALVNNGDGTFNYTPDPGYFGSDGFVYEVCDTDPTCDTASVSITVTQSNDPPVATANTATTAEDTSVTFDVAGDDTDPDGNLDPTSTNTSCATCSEPSNGTLVNHGDGTFTYSPSADFNGSDGLVYEICDTVAACDTAPVTITVTSVPDAPVAVGDTAVTVEDTLVTIDVVFNDTDADNNLSPATANTSCGSCALPTSGSLANNGNGTFDYLPNVGFFGSDGFVYEVCDTDALCDTASVSITINPSAPNILDVRVATGNDDAEESESGNTNRNSSDLEMVFDRSNQMVGMRFNGITIPQGATITNAYIQFQVDEVSTGTTNLTIEAEAIDDAPTFVNTSGNISSRDRTTASVAWTPAPWPTVGAAGADQQTPDIASVIQKVVSRLGWVSGSSLVVIITGTGERVAESYNGSATGAPLLHVEYLTGPPNTPPIATDDNETTAEDTTVTVDVAFNDVDPDGSLDLSSVNTTCTACSAPANGSLVNNGDGTFDYTPHPDFNGSDSWVYEICDTRSGCDTATVTITVTPSPDPPVAVDDTAITIEATLVTIDVTDNDTDPDNDLSPTTANTSCAGCSEPTNGSLANNGNGTFDYTPNAGFIGTDGFVYEVCDADLTCDTGSVGISVNPLAPSILEVRVANGDDDAEEKESGSTNRTSSDLELVFDKSNQHVGIRFTGVAIPQGATIVNAYIQFQVDEVSIDTSIDLTIESEAIADAPTFISASGNISTRDRTNASVQWIPAPWPNVGAAGPDQQTPDIAALIDEVVKLPGWVSGNSLVVIITGTGERVAESYNGDSSAAPLLHVEYYQ